MEMKDGHGLKLEKTWPLCSSLKMAPLFKKKAHLPPVKLEYFIFLLNESCSSFQSFVAIALKPKKAMTKRFVIIPCASKKRSHLPDVMQAKKKCNYD